MKLLKTMACASLIAITIIPGLTGCKKDDKDVATPGLSGRAANYKIAASVIFPPTANMYGHSYKDWSADYMKWFISKDCDYIGAANGAVQVSGLSSNVYYLLGPSWGGTKTVTVPQGKSTLLTLSWVLNDYPCSDDPAFQPAPGETLQHFLVQGAKDYQDLVDSLDIVLDGDQITGLSAYRTASYFFFTGNAALAGCLDPCITGTSQPGALDGYWYMLKPMNTGAHTLVSRVHFIGYGWVAQTTTNITVP